MCICSLSFLSHGLWILIPSPISFSSIYMFVTLTQLSSAKAMVKEAKKNALILCISCTLNVDGKMMENNGPLFFLPLFFLGYICMPFCKSVNREEELQTDFHRQKEIRIILKLKGLCLDYQVILFRLPDSLEFSYYCILMTEMIKSH